MTPHALRVFIAAVFALCLHGQSVALTFDDGLDPRQRPHAAAWNAAILDALARARVKSILFAVGKAADSPEGLALVRAWGEAGHGVGNHTYSHPSLAAQTTTLEGFEAEVLKNEKLLATLPGWTARLRFPYLKEGDTAEKRDGFRRWMTAHGYRPAPVSIDASDWYYSMRFGLWHEAHPEADLAPYRKAYLDHLWERATYYDELAKRLLGHSAQHVLLLHTNEINATFLSAVIEMFRSKGWSVISPEQAFADPLYALAPKVLPAGESILWSLAKERGGFDLRYPGEEGAYEKPKLDALGL